MEVPHFNSTPVSISYPSARTVRLDCQAQGIPPPQIMWLKNGKKLETVGRIKVQPSGLVFSHSFTTDEGMYQCVAENSAGRAWVSAQLVPYFSENRPNPPHNVQCEQYNDNSICLTWDPPTNTTIQAYSIFAFSPEGDRRDFVTNYTYHLATGLNKSTNYTVYVRSYSKDASDQSNNVSCRAGLRGTRKLEIQLLNETSVSLNWSKISNDISCGSTKFHYKVQWKRSDQSSVNVDYADGFTKVISGLRPSSTYEFKVQSNKNDDSPFQVFSITDFQNSSESILTAPSYLENKTWPAVPQQIEAQPLSPNSINVTWLNMEDHLGGIMYTLCYVEVEDERNCENGQLITSTTNYLVFKNLKPNTLYEFKVRSEISLGNFSSFSNSVQVQTFTDIPSPVQYVRSSVINSTAVCLMWRNPMFKNGKITGYVVLYTSDLQRPIEQWDIFNVTSSQLSLVNCWPNEEDSTSALLTNLRPSTHYNVVVRAVTKAGLGKLAGPISFTTKENIATNIYSGSEEHDSDVFYKNDPYYNQKLGITLGISISILCIICCISCILFRKRCLKRQALRHAQLVAAINNHYPTDNLAAPCPTSSLCLRHQETCGAEAHEMQQLVSGDEGSLVNIQPITPMQLLDTKGGADFPNGNVKNGLLKHAYTNGNVPLTQNAANGHVPNGLMHITENPRYNFADTKHNGIHSSSMLKKSSGNSESSNDKFKNNSHVLMSDYNSNCDDLRRGSTKDVDEDLVNTTQLTCLDDTFSSMYSRISPALGPNG